MFRRILVIFAQRAFLILIIVCLGCSAQPGPSAPTDLARVIERQVRSYYSVPPDVKIVVAAPHPSEFPDYDAIPVTIDNGEKKQEVQFFISKDRKTLARAMFDLTKDPYAALMQKIDVSGRPTRGAKDAKVVAVNYDDFQCPFCSRMHETLFPTLLQEYGDRVTFIYKDYPLHEIHPWAIHAAVNANCLAAQSGDAYWEFADSLHLRQKEVNSIKGSGAQFAALDKIAADLGQKHRLEPGKLQACIKAQDDRAVQASIREGDGIGVSATPVMFVNGRKVDGAVPIEDLRKIFDSALRDAGIEPPAHKPAAQPKAAGETTSR